MDDGSMRASDGRAPREHPDDPEDNAHTDEIVAQYEGMFVRSFRTGSVERARLIIRHFTDTAMLHADDDRERVLVRRLSLSAELQMVTTFHGDVDEGAAVAGLLVALPCHTRLAQLWQVAAFAAHCCKQGRPGAAWPHLLRAVRVVESQIPTHERWIAGQEYFRGILRNVWESMSEAERSTSEPWSLAPNEA